MSQPSRGPGRRAGAGLLIAPLALLLAGCDERLATRSECDAIFRRIVAIEVHEQGFRDPELQRIREAQLRERYDAQIDSCVGMPLPADAIRCLERAETTEALSHECLR